MSFENSAYAVLGIAKGSSEKEIKNAYVNLVKKYDPEKHTERFMVIQAAYDRLRQPKTRAKEDVHTYSLTLGEYLFNPDEKWTDNTTKPEEGEMSRLRVAFLDDPMDDGKRREFCRALFRRAHYLVQRKQFSDAIRDWSEVIDHDPSHARARHNLELACGSLGISYALHGLYDEAIELLERALKLNPDNTDLLHNLALIAEKAQDGSRALRYWDEVLTRWKVRLEKDPEDEYLRFSILEALGHQTEIGEQPWIRNAVRQALGTGPQTTASTDRVSRPSTSGAPRPQGSSSPEVRRPSSDEIRTGTESSANNQVKSRSAGPLDRFREIVQLNPEDFDAHFQLCNKLMEEQLYGEALEELQRVAKKHPKNTEVWNLMGWAYLNNNQKDMAFNSWKRSLSIDPKNPQTRENLVKAHLLLGKAFRSKGIFTQALVHFKQLLMLMPKSAEVHLEIAATYDMKGDVRSAAHEYNEVIKYDPKNKVARKALNDLRLKR